MKEIIKYLRDNYIKAYFSEHDILFRTMVLEFDKLIIYVYDVDQMDINQFKDYVNEYYIKHLKNQAETNLQIYNGTIDSLNRNPLLLK